MAVIFNQSLIFIGLIVFASFIIRFYFFPIGVPLTLDSLTYFWYASDISISGGLPHGHTFANNGWPIFLAPFFALIKLNNMISYMELQRLITIIISLFTTIPIYFLCKRFVNRSFALFGAAIFAFEPRLIEDSLFGLNNSLYILLVTISVILFFRSGRISMYFCFLVIAIASIIRSEGLFLFFGLSISYFIKHRKHKNELLKYPILFGIFIITILPVAWFRYKVTGSDALSGRILGETTTVINNLDVSTVSYVTKTFVTFFSFLGRDLVPIFIFFIPVGIWYLFRNRTFEKNVIILITIVTAIPAVYAYSVQSLDTKYLYFLYPMFCIFSTFGIKKYSEIIKKPNLVILISIFGLIAASILFLSVKFPDSEEQTEYFEVAKFIVKNTSVINDYYPGGAYLVPAEIENVWPIKRVDYVSHTRSIDPTKFNSLNEFIEKSRKNGLTELVIDDKENQPIFLKDVLRNEKDFPYLEKIYDSKEHGLSINLKVFRINYERFDVAK